MILDKTKNNPVISGKWGVLGNPTPEQIKEWCELPAGRFTEILKQAKSKSRKKVKPIQEFTVYVIKTRRIQRQAIVKVNATDAQSAFDQVRKIKEEELTFGEEKESPYQNTTCQTWPLEESA
jgi:hypothetical protein